ncbi:MAG: hypothetical protein J7K98_00110 [Candidatus Aenigmarchaeota archaeon]|nr:hypothetical protein [Candidatus Aenigmarchaeota archaeon]
MEEKEIVVKFLTNGFQLHPNTLQWLKSNEKKIDEIIQKLKSLENPPIIVDLKVLETLFQEKQGLLKFVELKKRKEKLKVDDVLKYYTSRYEKIKKMLLGKLELPNIISINKITPLLTTFSLIGIVREKNDYDKSIVLEDPTGEVRILLEESDYNDVLEDDVIGVKCKRKGREYVGKVVWPDIPLDREVNKLWEESYLLIGWGIKEYPTSGKIFVLDFENQNHDLGTPLFLESDKTVPQSLKIENLNILLIPLQWLEDYKKIWGVGYQEIVVKFLKRRHLSPKPPKPYLSNGDDFVIEELPDIIIIPDKQQRSSYKNYKGTTIIVAGKESVVVDLRNREVKVG